MTTRPSPRISLRKVPRQARSEGLVADILEGAAQVLAEVGATGFTTARVAEKAGVSVGSLYQYFPNKAAILFRLQSDEWRQTGDLLRGLAEDAGRPPLERLRGLVHAFVRSEVEEAGMRVALADAAPLYRDAPEAHAAKEAGGGIIQGLIRMLLPAGSPEATCALVGDLIATTLSSVGKDFSRTHPSAVEVHAYAEAMADMFCAYLNQLHTGR